MSNILIVDDEASIRQTLLEVLGEEGHTASAVESGEACLETLRKHSFEVILLDIWLPGADGLETLQKIRELENAPEVVMISGHGTIETAVRATKLGAFDFLEKPLSLDKTLIIIKNAVDARRLREENREFRKQIVTLSVIVGDSVPMKALRQQIGLMAPTNGRVLIYGESGTGKELVAHAIHAQSLRKEGPFVELNCAAIPETLLEAELFGYAKGSFTGAIDKKIGLFEEANGGTLFLDEIGDLSQPLQAKLLRVLQDRKIKRIGENRFRDINVRIVAATHRNLKQEVHEHRFREDLYFRLNVIPIHIPPLRERPEDILPLAEFFLRRFATENMSSAKRFSKDTLAFLLKHQWSGNVRELENTIERAAVLCQNEEITPADMLVEGTTQRSTTSLEVEENMGTEKESLTPHYLLDDVVKSHIIRILEFNKGAKDKTAKMLGIDRKTLYRKLNEYGY